MNEILQKRIEKAAETLINYNLVDLGDLVNQYDLRRMLIEMGVKTLQNQWISVKEELPKKTQECFVKCCIGNEQFNYTSMFDSHTQRFDDSINDEVTHWMPIPELLKGGEECQR